MNLYVRLIFMLLRLIRHTKQHPLEVTERYFLVWPNDLDINMHVNNGRYLTLMDLGRVDFMFKADLFKTALKKRWMPVLGSAKIHFLRPLKLFARFKLTTQVIYWDEKWVYLEQNFFHKDRLMATAYVRALFLEKGQKVPAGVVLEALEHDLKCPEPPEKLIQWIESEKGSP